MVSAFLSTVCLFNEITSASSAKTWQIRLLRGWWVLRGCEKLLRKKEIFEKEEHISYFNRAKKESPTRRDFKIKRMFEPGKGITPELGKLHRVFLGNHCSWILEGGDDGLVNRLSKGWIVWMNVLLTSLLEITDKTCIDLMTALLWGSMRARKASRAVRILFRDRWVRSSQACQG